MLPDQYLSNIPSNTSIYKGEINNAYLGDNLSRKSLSLQPVMLVDAEKYSDHFSTKGSVKNGRIGQPVSNSNGFHHANFPINNFQL